MNRRKDLGQCENCGKSFEYYLIHNGFGNTSYAHSDSTCYTAVLDEWKVPPDRPFSSQKKIKSETEEFLTPAPDGGIFRSVASPRCPHCEKILDPVKATNYIEANAEGSKSGWTWQGNWDDCYCIVIEDRIVYDNWR